MKIIENGAIITRLIAFDSLNMNIQTYLNGDQVTNFSILDHPILTNIFLAHHNILLVVPGINEIVVEDVVEFL